MSDPGQVAAQVAASDFDSLWQANERSLRAYIRVLPGMHGEENGYLGYVYLVARKRGYQPVKDGKERTFLAFVKYTAKVERWRYLYEDKVQFSTQGEAEKASTSDPGADAAVPRLADGDGAGPGNSDKSGKKDKQPAVWLRREEIPHSLAVRQQSMSLVEKHAIWQRIFSIDYPPHQLIVFAFTRLLEWKPSEVAAELWFYRLRLLRDLAEDLLYEQEPYRPATLALSPLLPKMNQELDAVLTQQADRETYANLLKKVCGEVALHGYATANSYEPAECVSRWTENVIRTLRNRNVFEEYRPDSGGKTAGTAHESIEGAEAE